MTLHDDVRRLVSVAEKLLRETERLRRDVKTLGDRIEAFDDEHPAIEPPEPDFKKRWRVIDALAIIEAAAHSIRNCEHDLFAVRARMDTIVNDAWSREDFKSYLR